MSKPRLQTNKQRFTDSAVANAIEGVERFLGTQPVVGKLRMTWDDDVYQTGTGAVVPASDFPVAPLVTSPDQALFGTLPADPNAQDFQPYFQAGKTTITTTAAGRADIILPKTYTTVLLGAWATWITGAGLQGQIVLDTSAGTTLGNIRFFLTDSAGAAVVSLSRQFCWLTLGF